MKDLDEIELGKIKAKLNLSMGHELHLSHLLYPHRSLIQLWLLDFRKRQYPLGLPWRDIWNDPEPGLRSKGRK